MVWFVFAALSAFISGLVPSIDKRILHTMHPLKFSALFALLNVVILSPLFLFVDLFIPKKIALTLYIGSIFGTLGFLNIMKALRHLDVSIVSPLTNLSPLFLAVIASVVLHEKLSVLQIFGMFLILLGAYVLESKHLKNVLEPIQHIVKNKYTFFIVLSAFFYALSSTVDKLVLSQITLWQYLLLVHVFIAANFAILSLFDTLLHKHHHTYHTESSSWKIGGLLCLSSVLTVGYRLFQAVAVMLGPVTLVSTVKHLSTLISTIIGGEFFHERHVKYNVFACTIMVIGVMCIVIFRH